MNMKSPKLISYHSSSSKPPVNQNLCQIVLQNQWPLGRIHKESFTWCLTNLVNFGTAQKSRIVHQDHNAFLLMINFEAQFAFDQV